LSSKAKGSFKINAKIIGELAGVSSSRFGDEIVEFEPNHEPISISFCTCCGSVPKPGCLFAKDKLEDEEE
jgi:hypothetical protein